MFLIWDQILISIWCWIIKLTVKMHLHILTCRDVKKFSMLKFLVDNIFVVFLGMVFQQIVGNTFPIYDKRDDFNFHITNFPFLSSNVPSSPVYGVFISQFIWYARACSCYEYFILRAARLSSKLLGQGYVMERLKSSLRKFYESIRWSHQTLWSLALPNVKWHSGTWQYTMTFSIYQTIHQFAN